MQNIGKSTQTYTKRRTHLGRPCLPRWLHFCVCRAKRTDTTATTKQWWMKVSSSNYPPNFRTKIWNKKLVRIRNEKSNSVGANIPVTHSKENLLHRLSNGRALLNILCALYREFISAAILDVETIIVSLDSGDITQSTLSSCSKLRVSLL